LFCKVNGLHCSLGIYWVNIRVTYGLIIDYKLEWAVSDAIAVEGSTSLALRHHTEFVEVIDALATGALGPGTREELDVAVDAEILITVGADCIVAYHLIRKATGY
jgi:hypothetical protein